MQDVLSDPVVAMDGNTYERAAISAWYTRSCTSPLTGESVDTLLVTNHTLRQVRVWVCLCRYLFSVSV